MDIHPRSWSAIERDPNRDVPLFEGALLIALDEYADLDIDACRAARDVHVEQMRAVLEEAAAPTAGLSALNRYLFDEQGFAGNHDQFDDPRNSYINEVLTRRLGIPISLAVLQLELGRQVGLALEGVSFPGHFLVRLPLPNGLVVLDPFHGGRALDAQELRRRARPHVGGDVDDDDLLQMLEPASHRAILARMLRNLDVIYSERRDVERSLRCRDRIVRLQPNDASAWRDRGLGYLEVGHTDAARADLSRYLRQAGDADDAMVIRERLIEIANRPSQRH